MSPSPGSFASASSEVRKEVASSRPLNSLTFAAAQAQAAKPVASEEFMVSPTRAAAEPREIMDIKAAASYLGVSRSHLSHLLAGKVRGVPAIPHVRAGRRALIRRAVIDQWILAQEQTRA